MQAESTLTSCIAADHHFQDFGRRICLLSKFALRHLRLTNPVSAREGRPAPWHSAAKLYDASGKDPGIEAEAVGMAANSAKYLAAEGAFAACER